MQLHFTNLHTITPEILASRVAETRTGRTWREIDASLAEMHLSTRKTRDGVVRQRTELTVEQEEILAALWINKPSLI